MHVHCTKKWANAHTCSLRSDDYLEMNALSLHDALRILWGELFSRDIDIRAEIIEPAIARRQIGYGGTSGVNYIGTVDCSRPATDAAVIASASSLFDQ